MQNFTSDWNSGLPFCAIIHRYRPGLLNYAELSPSKAEYNCELAFSVAEEKLGIKRLLDVADVANNTRPDEKSIIAYVSQFFKLFAKASKNDALLKSIRNAVEVTKRHDVWMEKYEAGAHQVIAWANQNTESLEQSSNSSTTEQVKAELEEFTAYMRGTKPNMQAAKAEVEGVATQLINSKRNNKRPEFTPSVSLANLNETWAQLEKVEHAREKSLLDKYQRFQQVDNEVSKFTGRAASLKAWLDEQNQKFSKPIYHSVNVTYLESELELQDSFDSRLRQYKHVFSELGGNAARVEELGRGEHEACDAVASQITDLASGITAVEAAGAVYRQNVEAALKAEREALKLERDFQRRAEALDFDIDQLEILANQAVVVSSASDVTALTQALSSLHEDVSKASNSLAKDLAPIAQKLATRNSKYTESVENSEARLHALNQTLSDREKLLQQKLAEESARDQLRDEFANLANDLGPELEQVSNQLASVSGDLEKQLEEVRAIRENISGPLKTKLDAVDAVAVKCDAAGIVNHPNSQFTVFTLQAEFDQLLKAANEEEQSLNAQILAKRALEVSPEQLKEIREVFNFFDTNNVGVIGLDALKEACTGAGIDLEEAEIERRMKEQKSDMLFTVEDFTSFMLSEIKSGDTIEDVKNAFEQLGEGADKLHMAKIEGAFQSEPELKAYILANMPDGDFRKFVQELFSR